MPSGLGKAVAAGGIMLLGGMLDAVFQKQQKQAAADQSLLQQAQSGALDSNTINAIDPKVWARVAGGDKKAGEALKNAALGKRLASEKAAALALSGLSSGKMNLEDPKSIQSYLGAQFTQGGAATSTASPEEMQAIQGLVKSAEPIEKERMSQAGQKERKGVEKQIQAAHDTSHEKIAAIHQKTAESVAQTAANARIKAAAEHNNGNAKWQQNYMKSMQTTSTQAMSAGRAALQKTASTLNKDTTVINKETIGSTLDSANVSALSNVVPNLPEVIAGGDPQEAIKDTVVSMADSLLIYDPDKAKVVNLREWSKGQGYDISKVKTVAAPPAVQQFLHSIATGTLSQVMSKVASNRAVYTGSFAPMFGGSMEEPPAPLDTSGESGGESDGGSD